MLNIAQLRLTTIQLIHVDSQLTPSPPQLTPTIKQKQTPASNF